MHVIRVRNVNHAYHAGMEYLRNNHTMIPSRNGPVLRAEGPVTTVYDCPKERVLFNPTRNCNPFFHYMEALWMLAGRNDVASVATFNKRMSEFSDDGVTFTGAYGYRWRNYFGRDQLAVAIEALKKNPWDRRVVVGMWDPSEDLFHPNSKDIPCNISLKFMARTETCLDMICFNRSNDIIWGAYGANAVHMSMVHEYVATMAGMDVGKYSQISCDFHAYVDVFEDMEEMEPKLDPCPYTNQQIYPGDLVDCKSEFDGDLERFVHGLAPDRDLPSSKEVHNTSIKDACYMARAWNCHKDKLQRMRDDNMDQVKAADWKRACKEWFKRRDQAWVKV